MSSTPPARVLAEGEVADENAQDELAPLPSKDVKGILPTVIRTIIQRRRAVKARLYPTSPSTR